MAQKYKESEEVFEHTNSKGKKRVYPVTRKGVTIVHLFEEEWRVGRLVEKKGKPAHVVIYAPNDKLYHAYGEDALKIFDAQEGGGDGYHKRGTVDRSAAKIWILTNVLDDPDLWTFDMVALPEPGRRVKVIYENGTIKWIEKFKGDWGFHRMSEKRTYPVFNEIKAKEQGRQDGLYWNDNNFMWEHKYIVAWRLK